MTHTQLLQMLRVEQACPLAIRWVEGGGFDMAGAWRACKRADWLLWFAGKAGTNTKALVRSACDCARLALPYVRNGDTRPLRAIQVAEQWCDGRTTIEEVLAAYAAAYAAGDARARGAAYAAGAAVGDAAAAYAAADVAGDAAAAAYAAGAAGGDATAGDAAAAAAYAAADAAWAAAGDAASAAAAAAVGDARAAMRLRCARTVRKRITSTMILEALATYTGTGKP